MAAEIELVSLSGNSIYCTIRRQSDAKVRDIANSAWDTWSDGDIGDYDLALTDRSGDLYQADFPTDIASGRYTITFYLRAGGAPAITDLILHPRLDVTWNGADLSGGGSVTLAANALTSLNRVKAYTRISTSNTTHDDLIKHLINEASDRIERLTNRKFAAADYRQWLNGDGEGRLVVPYYPIIYIQRMASGSTDALEIQYSGNAIRATVQVYDAGIRTHSMVAAGTETNTNTTFASYPTLSTMATQISTISGWTATQQGDDASSKDLHQTGGVEAKSQSVTFTRPGSDSSLYRLDREGGVITLQGSVDFAWDTSAGELAMPQGFGNILVEYRAGYETIPEALDGLCARFVADLFNHSAHDGSIQSESIGDYSYSLANQVEVTNSMRAKLEPWISLSVGSAA